MMVNPCNSSESPCNVDRISELPDEILEYVTSKLTLRDAIRTKVLSTRWNHVGFSSRSNLVFDSINFFETPQTIVEEDLCDQFRVRFVDSVNRFLGTIEETITWRIQDFSIDFCLGVDYQEDIDKWVRFAIGKGAQNLKLQLHCAKKSKLAYDHQLLLSNHSVFPTILPDHHRCVPASTLKTLSLGSCCPGQSLTNTQIFGCLNFLTLCYVNLKGYDLSSMLSCLKKLTTFTFLYCHLPKVITLRSLDSLQSFYVLFPSGARRIQILNRKLGFPPDQVQIVSSGQMVSNNRKFCFFAYEKSWDCILRRLDLSAEDDNWGDRLPLTMSMATVAYVTCVSITLGVRVHFDLSKMICALKGFPRLRKLCIVNAEHVQLVDFEHDKHVYERLEEIAFFCFRATSNEIQLLIYFLAHAPSLKTIVIDPNPKVNYDQLPEHLKVGQRRLMGQRLLMGDEERLRKSLQPFSRDVDIIFK